MLEEKETKELQEVEDEARTFEFGVLAMLLFHIRNVLNNDSPEARAEALRKISKETKRMNKKFKNNIIKKSQTFLLFIGNKAKKELDHKSKLFKPKTVIEKWQKENKDYFKKYIKTQGTNIVVGNKKPKQFFTNFIEQEIKDVVNGNITIDDAIAKACKKLSENGVQYINYDSGRKLRVEAFVRQQVLYSEHKVSQDIRFENAKKDGVTIFEWSAHADARPSHKKWQGKRFDITGKYYPKSVSNGEENDYGCRHICYPVYNKDDPYMMSKEELENIDTKPFEFENETYTGYEARKKMRYLERQIRDKKLELNLLETMGLKDSEDYKKAKAQLRKRNGRYSTFCKAYGTYRHTDRLRVAPIGTEYK